MKAAAESARRDRVGTQGAWKRGRLDPSGWRAGECSVWYGMDECCIWLHSIYERDPAMHSLPRPTALTGHDCIAQFQRTRSFLRSAILLSSSVSTSTIVNTIDYCCKTHHIHPRVSLRRVEAIPVAGTGYSTPHGPSMHPPRTRYFAATRLALTTPLPYDSHACWLVRCTPSSNETLLGQRIGVHWPPDVLTGADVHFTRSPR
ncbi:hypothetical protein N7474_000124 [Penicillium riverlandense]|uniref:uncharacterized protein n=1 Tax=Penicillium riverlandense TaxID=1903569 RepID=UPI0025479D20|nr:uncharacterized protein N7474_000124 [Penicillium riverlandense]KAJ5831813.1 hypothetical protein N7474_000124 [Penicillium riverlandense]